jgi:hypothetical protein
MNHAIAITKRNRKTRSKNAIPVAVVNQNRQGIILSFFILWQ